jgi:hypothetical protein
MRSVKTACFPTWLKLGTRNQVELQIEVNPVEGLVVNAIRGLCRWFWRWLWSRSRRIVSIFIFAIITFNRIWIFPALVSRQRADHHVDAAPDELRLKIGMAKGRDGFDKFFDDLKTEFLVRHFPAAEFERDLHLHVLAQKTSRMLDLDAEIVRINAGTQLDFLDDGGVLVLFGILLLLGLFVAELADFNETADGRRGVGRDFNQVNSLLPRQGQRLVEGNDAELFFPHDDADFAGADFAVDPEERIGRRMA